MLLVMGEPYTPPTEALLNTLMERLDIPSHLRSAVVSADVLTPQAKQVAQDPEARGRFFDDVFRRFDGVIFATDPHPWALEIAQKAGIPTHVFKFPRATDEEVEESAKDLEAFVKSTAFPFWAHDRLLLAARKVIHRGRANIGGTRAPEAEVFTVTIPEPGVDLATVKVEVVKTAPSAAAETTGETKAAG